MKKRILIGVIALLLAVGLVLPMTGVSQAAGTLTLRYYTDNNGGGSGGTAVFVNSVVVKKGGTAVASAGNVTGTVSFSLADGAYTVDSTKGAFTRTADPVTVGVIADIPCGKLITNYRTNNDGTGDQVFVNSVVVNKTGGGGVASAGNVTGSTSFALLATGKDTDTDFFGTYDVVSTKGAFTRTETGVTVASDNTLNVPCGKLIVTYYGNDKPAWGTFVNSVVVNKTGGGGVASAGNVTGSTSFALLATTGTGFTYDVVSTAGASTRTETGVTVASTQTLDVPVARFRVMVVKGDFTAQFVNSVVVSTAGGGVASAGNVTGYVDFSLLQSSANGAQLNGTPVNGTGASQYTFKATKNGTTAQTPANADEGPPDGLPGLSGVILMIP